MNETLKPGHFRGLAAPLTLDVKVGEEVQSLQFTVSSVSALPAHRFREEPFSLVLESAAAPSLPQGNYPLKHPTLGPLVLFLVPIARIGSATQYEVTFN